MAENLDALKQGYDAYGRGDSDAVRALWADDIEWQGPDAEGLPGSGTHRGKDGVMQMLGEIAEAWDDFTVSPDEFIEQGETIVVLGHNEATAKSTGNSVKVPFVHIWRMSDGKVDRVQTLTDTKVVADAL